MSRTRRAVFSLASGYLAIICNAVCTFASVPLALHYLTPKEFSLWANVVQVVGCLTLIEMGITGAVGRFLIDHKDDASDGQYGAVIKTGSLVLLAQGLCIAAGGIAVSFCLRQLFPKVPEELQPPFQTLVAGSCIIAGFFFSGRVLMAVLQAHQRFDSINYTSIWQLLAGFATQWVTFHFGWKLNSLLAASFVSAFVGVAGNLWSVRRLKLFPASNNWGRLSRKVFKDVFGFANELFMLSVGLQLLNGSQVMIITNTVSLEAGAVWAVATKVVPMAYQFVQRIFDFSAGAFGEMIVRGEWDTLKRRYRDVLLLTASVAVFASASVAVCNSGFLHVWMPEKWKLLLAGADWPWWNDALIGALLLLNCVTRCQIGLSGYAKQIGRMRWIYFLEGAAFVGGSLIVGHYFGMTGVIVVAIVANLACSGSYGFRWAGRYLDVGAGEILGRWLRPALDYLVLLLPVVALLWWGTFGMPPLLKLIINVAVMSIAGLGLMWRMGLTLELRELVKTMLGKVRARLRS